MLKPKQKKCAEMLALGQFTQKEIAKQINVSEKTICEWKKNDEFMSEYDSLLRSGMKSMAAKAFKTETALLESHSEMVRLTAAKDILDRSGYKAGENLSINVEPVTIVNDLKE